VILSFFSLVLAAIASANSFSSLFYCTDIAPSSRRSRKMTFSFFFFSPEDDRFPFLLLLLSGGAPASPRNAFSPSNNRKYPPLSPLGSRLAFRPTNVSLSLLLESGSFFSYERHHQYSPSKRKPSLTRRRIQPLLPFSPVQKIREIFFPLRRDLVKIAPINDLFPSSSFCQYPLSKCC